MYSIVLNAAVYNRIPVEAPTGAGSYFKHCLVIITCAINQ